MAPKKIRLNARRLFRRRRRQLEDFSVQAEKQIDKHFVNRLVRLIQVRRFIIIWAGLLILLGGSVVFQTQSLGSYYQRLEPVPGGIYTEGILGDFTTANPLFATGSVDNAVSRLVFASLFTYNSHDQLVGDLASSWSVDATGKIYTVRLKPHLVWQDGQSLTANDVAFTYDTIQNPDVQSPLYSSWQNVKVEAVNPTTITFSLSNPLNSFPYSLTNGIVPEHILSDVPPSELRSASFNTNPVGSGPFAWQSLVAQAFTPETKQEQINLIPFARYVGGEPKLDGFIIRAFHDQNQMISSFEDRELNGMAGLDSVPAAIAKSKDLNEYSMQLTAANMVFFKTSSGVLADPKVREAIAEASNVNNLISQLGYPVSPVREPLLNDQVGFNAAYEQATDNMALAESDLTSDGWVASPNSGVRYKNNVPLKFTLSAENNQDNQIIATGLQKQLHAVGIDMSIDLENNLDFEDTVTFHDYDALLYGISIGQDSDVFAYWDSSQVNNLNFSEYKSSAADEGLESARIITNDPALAAIKYQTFLQAWQSDVPALALYQPRFLYLTNQPVFGLNNSTINQTTDRFNNVQQWEIRQGRVSNQAS